MNFCCSSISQTIINNDVDRFKELLNKRKRIDIHDNLGYSSLHIAVKLGAAANLEIVNLLLEHPDIEIDARSFEGHTSLYLACNNESPNLEIIKNILNHGADPNIGDSFDITPLHLACQFGYIELVELLMEYTVNINSQDFNLETPLHYAIERNFKDITLLLLKANANTNIKEQFGMNPLMSAITHNCEFAEILVPYTSGLNNESNSPPIIMIALRRNNFEMVKLLVEHGVDLYLSKNSPDVLLTAIEQCDYKVFEYIWNNINPEKLAINTHFWATIFTQCILHNDFRYLVNFFNVAVMDWNIRREKGVFSHIFQERLLPLEISLDIQYHFKNNKCFYIEFIEILLDQGILLSSADIESFINYFKSCPYKIKLFKLIMEQNKPDITEYLVMFAAYLDVTMGALLLQYCIHLYPENLYESILRKMFLPEIVDILKYVLSLFTPTKFYKRKLELAICMEGNSIKFENDNELSKLLNNDVKSLIELSRDVIRSQIQDVCEESSEFLEIIKNLDAPEIVKDYITLKLPVRKVCE